MSIKSKSCLIIFVVIVEEGDREPIGALAGSTGPLFVGLVIELC